AGDLHRPLPTPAHPGGSDRREGDARQRPDAEHGGAARAHRPRRRRRGMSPRALRRALALAAACALAAAPAALADTITLQPGPSTLGEAILLAEPGDVIELPAGRFLLTEGDTLEEKDL